MAENSHENIAECEFGQLPNGILIKSICDQEIERLKFISCLGALLEDLADIETSTAKSFGRTISNFVSGKQDGLAGFGTILEEISKFSTQQGGKNHAAIANNITSNVCKIFPEYSKIYRKKIYVIFQKLSAIQEDLKKAKIVQNKNEENYSRLVKEAEMCVRYRDNPDLYEKTMETDRDSFDEKDKYKNMSFSKMISKMTTNDKKSPSEQVAEIVREVDSEERQLEANSKRLTVCRANLLVETERAMSEILGIERTRVVTLIDGFMKVFAIFEQFNHKIGESANSIDKQLTSFKFDSSVRIPGDLPISECSGLSFIPAEEWTDSLESIHSGVPQVAVKVERFLDILENSIQYIQKTHQLFDEVSDVERSRNRSFKKLLEKYDAVSTGELLSTTATAESLCKLNKFFVSELSEVFPVRQMTASLVILMRIMNDISARSGDLSMGDICKEVSAAQKRISNIRKELKDGYFSFLRNMESNYSQFSKLRAKLQKTHAFLKERTSTIKQAKLNAGLGADSVAADSSSVAAEMKEPTFTVACTVDEATYRAFSPSAERRSSNQFASIVSGALNTNALAQQQGGADSSPSIAPDGNNSLYRMTSMKNKLENFGSSLRSATKLKQVVGLESPSDRVHRIENQIVAIEKEERELQAQAKKSFEELELFMGQSSMDLVNRLMASKTDLLSDLDQVKNALIVYVDWGKERKQLLGSGLSDLKIRLDACEKVVDQELFSTNPENVVVRFEIPEIDAFSPIKSDILDEERRNLKATMAATSGEIAAGLASPKSPRTSIVLTTKPLSAEPDLMMPEDTMQMHPRVSVSSPMLLRMNDIDSDDEIPDAVSQSLAVQGTGDNSSSRKVSNTDLLPSPPVGSPAITPSPLIVELKKSESTEVGKTTSNGMPSTTPSPLPPSVISTSSVAAPLVPTNAPVLNNSAVNYSVSVATDYELRRFGLDPSNKVLESFSCALYPKRGMLTHGRLFITQHFLAFSGWPDTRVLLSLSCVKKIEKTNTLMYIPNAISIICLIDNSAWAAATGEVVEDPCEDEFFFGSFIERELCFNLIRNLSEIEKRIAEISFHTTAGPDSVMPVQSMPSLEYGYQTHLAPLSWWGNDVTPVGAPSAIAAEDSRAAVPKQPKERLESPALVVNDPIVSNRYNVTNPTDGMITISKTVASVTPGAEKQSPTTVQQRNVISAPSTSAGEKVGTIAEAKKKKKATKAKEDSSTSITVPAEATVDNNQLKKLESMIADHQLITLAKKTVPFACHHFFLSNLRHGAAYTKYLETQDDFDISNTEWEPFSGAVPEDVTKTVFRWKRRFNNMHPRTTMLMFGPKNCSVKQDQYLSLLVPTDVANKRGSLSLDQFRVYGGVLLTIYEFDGIPMGDVFKVLQYYIFTPATVLSRDAARGVAIVSSNGKENGSQVAVGLTIHFRKSTMFKSQIISGSSEESGTQARNWLDGAETKVKEDISEFLSMEGGEVGEGEESDEFEEEITETGLKSDAGDGHASSDLTRRRSFGCMSTGLSAEEQKSALSNAANNILETTVASIRQEYRWHILQRERAIIGLLVAIMLLVLFVLYLFYNTNSKVATLEKLLQKQIAFPK